MEDQFNRKLIYFKKLLCVFKIFLLITFLEPKLIFLSIVIFLKSAIRILVFFSLFYVLLTYLQSPIITSQLAIICIGIIVLVLLLAAISFRFRTSTYSVVMVERSLASKKLYHRVLGWAVSVWFVIIAWLVLLLICPPILICFILTNLIFVFLCALFWTNSTSVFMLSSPTLHFIINGILILLSFRQGYLNSLSLDNHLILLSIITASRFAAIGYSRVVRLIYTYVMTEERRRGAKLSQRKLDNAPNRVT